MPTRPTPCVSSQNCQGLNIEYRRSRVASFSTGDGGGKHLTPFSGYYSNTFILEVSRYIEMVDAAKGTE